MIRLNLILFAVTIAMALGVVTAQYKARKLYFELDRQEMLTKQYMTEYDQLQIEQSTWAMHSRLEEFATARLHMHSPSMQQTQVMVIDLPAAPVVAPAAP
ncbi:MULTISPECIES: cell division protein FtsL [Methylophilus]|jgi:cell division protein FtsL|uniref:Cell division protein FtsL n=1 Tax=Methylophilus luteus TaxID=640108 RepID=A0ABW3F9R7_9PROT